MSERGTDRQREETGAGEQNITSLVPLTQVFNKKHKHTHTYVVGPGEFDGEGWEDGGVKWEENPGAFDELGYAADPDDGMFWMEWSTATRYFWSWILILFMLDFVCTRLGAQCWRHAQDGLEHRHPLLLVLPCLPGRNWQET